MSTEDGERMSFAWEHCHIQNSYFTLEIGTHLLIHRDQLRPPFVLHVIRPAISANYNHSVLACFRSSPHTPFNISPSHIPLNRLIRLYKCVQLVDSDIMQVLGVVIKLK
ncbi:hypothetical protein GWI33_016453 [Rhynchophorus ferrugineus]|uniref:Uncharacterized protein n=1 Tax=Rhynchophorus ferrugineus TaxID=354439 RepID=A0A834I3J7_RHYFE|nr:hypothetical protein GWI33_016453 [Rhynchophorus ferrugineus]